MEKKKVFADGLIFKRKRENSPEWVKGSVSIKVDEFKAFLDKHVNNGWCNLDFLQGKPSEKNPQGALYFALNDWKPKDPAGDMLAGMGDKKDNFVVPEDTPTEQIPF